MQIYGWGKETIRRGGGGGGFHSFLLAIKEGGGDCFRGLAREKDAWSQ